MPTVRVRVIGPDGQLTPPTEVPKVVLTDAQWRSRLTAEQYRIARGKGTEKAFCGGLLDNKEAGVYACLCCNLPLFESTAKFDSGTGWPSFFKAVATENIREELDRSHGMIRTEILCMRCDAHLGHVFKDGPPPTRLRYCLNSEVMRFVAKDQLHTIAEDPAAATGTASAAVTLTSAGEQPAEFAEAVLAGGCFWCVEAVFRQLDGVVEAISGYSGGTEKTANYKAVSTKRTGHAEAVKIIYDPAKLSYEQLLRVHFATHDPTTRNRQGNDVGPQYRSAIFYANEQEKELAEAFIADLNDAKIFQRPIVTTLEPLKGFYPAEPEHQDFVACNLAHPYVRSVALPKVEKVREKFQDLVKPEKK
ncbi:MAG: bifunctional methionine sulfoxide reductase B/A protein [Thermoguttaceae bacterium]|nr:bifunctional methionine sulfoxide reductase B/A protein [Thermoguttaceae bacterium]